MNDTDIIREALEFGRDAGSRAGEPALMRAGLAALDRLVNERERWLSWSGGDYPDSSPGDVIAWKADGTITLDDAITTWNPLRALAAAEAALRDAQTAMEAAAETLRSQNDDLELSIRRTKAAEARVAQLQAAHGLSKERATLILRVARSAGVGLDEKNALSKIEHEAEHWLGLARAALADLPEVPDE